MPRLQFPFKLDGIALEVWVGHSIPIIVAAGQANVKLPPPIVASAVIDTGATTTCVSRALIGQLGIPPYGRGTSTTANGVVPVFTYKVSLGLYRGLGLSQSELLSGDLEVGELAQPIEGIEVLVGLDVLSLVTLTLDGPNQTVTLDF